MSERQPGKVSSYDDTMAGAPDPGQAKRTAKKDPPTGPAAEDQAKEPVSHLTMARRGVAAALLVGWLVVVWVSFQTPYLHTCDDEVARVGNKALVQFCRPLSITDPPLLALLVVAGALLLPDLSALEIPGVFRLERQLKEQARRQDEIVAMIHRLEVTQHQQVYNVFDAALIGELVARQAEKERQFLEPDAS
jgi:hypothetical protein